MKLNRTKILVISLVVITLILGGVALYIANRLQTQIQTPSSAATANPPSPTYPCKVIYYHDAAFAEAYKATDTVPSNTILQLYISRTATGAFTNVGVNNVSLRKGTTRMAGIQPTGNNYSVSIPADQIAVGANVFEFGYNIQNNNVATGDWCEPFTITGKAPDNTSSPNAKCVEMTVGTSLTNQTKKNTRAAPLSVPVGSDIYITHTLRDLDSVDRTRYLRIYNGQNKTKNDGSENHNFVSYNKGSDQDSYQKSVGTGTGDIKFTYKLTYAQLFQTDSAALGFPQTPAETPQWASGQVPNYVKVIAPVKPYINNVGGSFGIDCQAYIKRADVSITVSNVNTSTAACVGMTLGKNGGTQTARTSRSNPLLLTTGDTLNVTHTLSNVPTAETSRTLRLYNAQNISSGSNNELTSFTSYYDSSATIYKATKVANGANNQDFKFTFTYADLFKADTTALAKAATPAEKPQWASGQVPNLLKIAVPVKPFSTGIEGTFSPDCMGYISRVGISLASTSGGNSGGSGETNDELPATDLSAFNMFELIGGAIFLLGGITIMKYRSRFENI